MDFNSQYMEYRAIPFPRGTSNDQIDEWRSELTLIDSEFADLVIPYVVDGTYNRVYESFAIDLETFIAKLDLNEADLLEWEDEPTATSIVDAVLKAVKLNIDELGVLLRWDLSPPTERLSLAASRL